MTFVCFGISAPAAAQLNDASGAKDNPGIKRYEGAVIIGYDFRKFNDYELLVGPIERTGQTPYAKPTKSQHVEGQTTRILYVVPHGRSPLEVFRNYEQELQKNEFRILYQCAREKCGAKDGWMGEHYLYADKRRLLNTPPDSSGRPKGRVAERAFTRAKDQHYVVAKRASPRGDVYASVYVALGQMDMHQETFDHALVLLDVIETKAMETKMVTVDASEMAAGIAKTGHIALYGIHFDTDKADLKPESQPTLQEIAKLLTQDPALKLHIGGHTDNVGAFDYNIGLSQRRAAAVVKNLTAMHGIATARLRPAGLGMLAPVAPNESEDGRAKNRRVELVKQ